jgi:hypothetical protein
MNLFYPQKPKIFGQSVLTFLPLLSDPSSSYYSFFKARFDVENYDQKGS